jgi:hypothetical protein
MGLASVGSTLHGPRLFRLQKLAPSYGHSLPEVTRPRGCRHEQATVVWAAAVQLTLGWESGDWRPSRRGSNKLLDTGSSSASSPAPGRKLHTRQSPVVVRWLPVLSNWILHRTAGCTGHTPLPASTTTIDLVSPFNSENGSEHGCLAAHKGDYTKAQR